MSACTGNVCVECCLCTTCGRKVGTRHLDACACPPDGMHFRCDECAAKFRDERIARIVDVLAPDERHGRPARIIDPNVLLRRLRREVSE